MTSVIALLVTLLVPALAGAAGAAAHLGPVHGVERLLVAVVAVAPFVVLAAAAVVVRRRDAREEEPCQGP